MPVFFHRKRPDFNPPLCIRKAPVTKVLTNYAEGTNGNYNGTPEVKK